MKKLLVKSIGFAIFMALIFLQITCKNDRSSLEESVGRLKLDTSNIITVPIDLDMSLRMEVVQYFEIEGNTQLMMYNRPKNQLDWIDLDRRQVVRKIPLPREGPHGIRKVLHFYFHNSDSIFVVSDYHLHLIDQEGNFAYSKLINNTGSTLKGINFDQYYLRVTRDRPIFFQHGELYCSISRVDHDRYTLPEYYEGPLVVKINLKDWKLETLPIFYPPELKENFYGFLSDVNFTFFPDRILYNFKYLPDVYIYDLQSGEITSISLPSQFLSSDPQPYSGTAGSGEELVKHLTMQVEFRGIMDILENDYYARFVMIPSKEHFGKTKRVGISFFDRNFNVIEELTLPNYHFYNGAGPYRGSLLVKYTRDQLENELKFREFKLASDEAL